MQLSHFKRKSTLFWTLIIAGPLLIAPWLLYASARENSDVIVINEFMAANKSSLADEDGDFSDWIELYNPGPRPAKLIGYALTDAATQPEKWPLPDITLGSREYLLIFASGKDRKIPAAKLHANFRLNQHGEFLGLYNILDDQFAATIQPTFPQQFDDVAYGHSPGSPDELTYGYLAAPTPGQPNEAVLWTGLVAPVNFSAKRGLYKSPFTLELSTATPGAAIYYTTDGSEPTATHGTIYTEPIPIDRTIAIRAIAFAPNLRPAPTNTYTYIFLDDVLAQPQNPPGFPKTWGGYQGSPAPADYEMDPEVINDPRYNGDIEAVLQSIPGLFLTMDMQSFHNLYANPKRRGRAWERPVSVEFFDPRNQGGFQVNAGLRIQGELGRSEFMPKHPFRLFFRNEYGAGKLNYPLFPDSPVETFDTLILRSGVNRSFAGYPERENDIRLTTYTRDEWLRDSQLAMSGSGARGIFVHLYLNGLYWGLYNLVERPDDDFMASYFGGVKEDWQFISHEETLTTDSDRFKTLHQLAAAGHLADPINYAKINAYLDTPHFIDYLILNWYAGNIDWAFNNWYTGVERSAGQVKYFVWDGERTWYDGAEIFMDKAEYLERPNLVTPLFEALLQNPDFKMALADHLYKHLYHDGALTEANAQARWIHLNNIIEQAIIAESARWGDSRFEPPLTQADWFKARDDVLAQMEGNAARLIELARAAGYYPQIDPPIFNQHGGAVEPGFEVVMTLPDKSNGGIIYITTGGSDPRLPESGAIAPNATPYESPLRLTTPTHLKARIWKDNIWSALHEATFTIIDK
jgi:hypothetical protein